jgi:hypothetical protein
VSTFAGLANDRLVLFDGDSSTFAIFDCVVLALGEQFDSSIGEVGAVAA